MGKLQSFLRENFNTPERLDDAAKPAPFAGRWPTRLIVRGYDDFTVEMPMYMAPPSRSVLNRIKRLLKKARFTKRYFYISEIDRKHLLYDYSIRYDRATQSWRVKHTPLGTRYVDGASAHYFGFSKAKCLAQTEDANTMLEPRKLAKHNGSIVYEVRLNANTR